MITTLESTSAYIERIEQWRRKTETDLRAPDSYLSLTGLFELSDGVYTIGSAATCEVLLPASAPAQLGSLTVAGKRVHLAVQTDAPVLIAGQVVREADLDDDGDGAKTPTKVTLGTITFFVHSYGDKMAIRVKDSANPAIRNFGGRVWFPVKSEYRVAGRFVPHAAPQKIQVESVVDTLIEYHSPGIVMFELQGRPMHLLVTDQRANKLGIILRDATAGQHTYGAGRFLTIETDDDLNADVDFNQAYSPPCAFTDYATCPLPPRENILPIAIEAGELYIKHDDLE